ncbi:DUF6244 family protein [Longispora albida]|uniref:DUF6244 family protein n=1 Tax=Longispora albida TaxID=203523 RepID=UPI000370ED19|nr:DUF6244 family protein [Longispora albida]
MATVTAPILSALANAGVEISDAQATTATTIGHADRVRQQAHAQGLDGVAHSMSDVVTSIETVAASLGAAHAAVRDAEPPVRGIGSGTTPQEVRERLLASIAAIDTSTTAITACFPPLDTAESTVRTALAGAEPGPLLRLLDQVNQAAARGKRAAGTARNHAAAQIPEVTAIGGLGGGGGGGGGTTGAAKPVKRPVGHGTLMRRLGITEGPVILRLVENPTDDERLHLVEYVEGAQRALEAGQTPVTGRVSVRGQLNKDKERAAELERRRAQAAGEPYGELVAAHLPDTTWTGVADPPQGWGRHTHRMNSSLGSQSARYPVGYRPESFEIEIPRDEDDDDE